MKKCPFCAEDIQDEAVKCKHCGEFLKRDEKKAKWYFTTTTFVISVLCVGPFALPLLWFNPAMSKKKKIIISAIVIILSYILGIWLKKSIESLDEYYKIIFSEMKY